MKLNITSRHFKARPELTEAVETAVQHFTQFHDGIISTDVILENGDIEPTVEFIVHVSGKTLVAKDSSSDFFKSLHGASDNMVRQIRKIKTRAEKGVHSTVSLRPPKRNSKSGTELSL